ncbi:hypothetical protein PG988_012738 [Apiospora saccharicola]
MARHSFNSLLAEYRSLQEENEALRLRDTASQRQLSRQDSSNYELRTELQDERQTVKELRECQTDQNKIIQELREGQKDQNEIMQELRKKLEEKDEAQMEMQVQLSNKEAAYQALLLKYKESDERITKSIAHETQEAYRWAIAERVRAHAAEKHAAEEKFRADVEKVRADAREEEAEVEAEANHRLFQELMNVSDRNIQLANDCEAFCRTSMTLQAENLSLRSRLRWTESGIFRRIRNDAQSAVDSDEEHLIISKQLQE